jgi:chromosome segregation protein
LRLDRVEIAGFKSFCDKQELDFRLGVTGIVGPNGCGKSNISDAISWVLGEQSAKSLRGSSMADVIFAGSQARQPLNMAEVSLRVSGLNGNSPDGSPEAVVTRRLYRNGESEYLMNGQVCRLRDIHELFMDTGLGSKAYSIIEQGKIGLILSSKPADRRALLEEAAGITKYKLRRRQTQLKLEAAQQNLLRVDDIVHEVEKQLDGLRRQAGRARRYRALRDQMQGLERVVYGRRFLELSAQAEELDHRLRAEREREQAASLALSTEEAQIEARRHGLYEEEARLEAARQLVSELTLAVERQQGRIGYCQEQMAEAAARAGEARAEAEDLGARLLPVEAQLGARRAEAEGLEAERRRAEAEAQASEGGAGACAAELLRREGELERAREGQVEAVGRMAALRNAADSVTGDAERAASVLVKLAGESAELAGERRREEEARSAAQARRRAAEERLETRREQRSAREAEAQAARARTEALALQTETAQSERDGLAGRHASLEEIVATHAAFDEGVRALLGRPEGGDVLGVVADLVETAPEDERAVEAFLAEALQAVLVPDARAALGAIAWLQETAAGRASLLAVEGEDAAPAETALGAVADREPAVRGLLSARYRVTGPHAARIRAALPEALLVRSLEEAVELVARRGPFPCVTPAGETVRGAIVGGGRTVKGLLAPRREVREVGERLLVLDEHLGRLRQDLAEEKRREEEAQAELRRLDDEIHAAEKDLLSAHHELLAADEEDARLGRKAAVLATERAQAEEERGAAVGRLAEIEQSLLTAEAERAGTVERVGALAAAVAEGRLALEAAQARHADARSALAALRERLLAAAADAQRLGADLQDLRERIEAAAARALALDGRGQELVRERSGAEGLLARALHEQDRARGEATVVEDAVRDLRNELEGREHALRERRRERDMLREAAAEVEVAAARNGSDLEHLARECRQALGLSAAASAAALGEEERTRDLAALEGEIQALRERLDRMGPVNVLAVEQAQELEERHQFLTTQRRDLLDSIAELDQAIRKIDRTSRERFEDAFRVINQHFGEVFRELFGGGTAGLSLLDEDDLLESGIDVMAQPPGKRLQNVLLLSGGEKALTAIALLFAIFNFKPSPFCILDEVDAPLDDANIGRFVRMLDRLKDQTQFILITHSRRTMEIADQLYGVTMEEPGVSKLVSVRLN